MDVAAARTCALTPKMVSEYFKPYMMNKLMELCGVTTEASLPDLWSTLAAQNGKCECAMIDNLIQEAANDVGYPHLAPVITPGLAKKVLGLHLAGTSMDNLSEGVSPFMMIIQDYTSPTSGRDYLEATRVAQDYDNLVGGSFMADLSDIKTINSSTKVQVPMSYPTARAMLQAYAIFLGAILGTEHDRVKSHQAFINNYTAKETFHLGRLSSMDGVCGPARLLHYIQLLMRAWFYEKELWWM